MSLVAAVARPHSFGASAAKRSALGGADETGFYATSRIAPFVGQSLMLMWFLFVSLSMILKQQTTALRLQLSPMVV